MDSIVFNDAAPKLIPGGGAEGGAIAGRLNVHVIAGDTGMPIKGAYVVVGGTTGYTGTTGDGGLVSFQDKALRGPVNLTVAYKDHTTITIVGLNAANYTAKLLNRGPSKGDPLKLASCKGTVSGWTALPALAKGHKRFAKIVYLQTEIDEDRNWIEQTKPGMDTYPPATSTGETEWAITVPAGSFGVAALVWDTDTKETQSTTDDTILLTHMGVKRGLSVQEGKVLGPVAIPVDATSESLKVVTTGVPAALKNVNVHYALQLSATEVIPILVPIKAPSVVQVAKLAGAFAGGNYWVTVEAAEGAVHDYYRSDGVLFWKRGLTPPTTVTATMLPLPSNTGVASGGQISFTLANGVDLVEAGILPGKEGDLYWKFIFVSPDKGPSSFMLPQLPASVQAPVPPAGKIYLRVDALDLSGTKFNEATNRELVIKKTRSGRTSKAFTW